MFPGIDQLLRGYHSIYERERELIPCISSIDPYISPSDGEVMVFG